MLYVEMGFSTCIFVEPRSYVGLYGSEQPLEILTVPKSLHLDGQLAPYTRDIRYTRYNSRVVTLILTLNSQLGHKHNRLGALHIGCGFST